MKQNPTDDELRSYLLGELPEPQADALEERILKDDELFDLVEGLEADLLDAASRGELAPAERERVLQRLASSPEGRGRLALARSLNTVANETARRVVPFRPRPKPVFQWASTLAATGLLAAVGLFLFMQQQPPPHGGHSPSQVAEESPTPKNPALPRLPEPKTPATGTTPTPEPSPALDQIAGKSEETPEVRPELVKAVFTLALTSLRSEGEEVAKFPLPPNADVAEIRAYFLEPVDPGPFDATVRSKDRGTVWEGRGLKTQTLDGDTVLVLDIPTKHLKPGRYEVAVNSSFETTEMIQELDIVQKDDR